jgi:hypothetical protein
MSNASRSSVVPGKTAGGCTAMPRTERQARCPDCAELVARWLPCDGRCGRKRPCRRRRSSNKPPSKAAALAARPICVVRWRSQPQDPWSLRRHAQARQRLGYLPALQASGGQPVATRYLVFVAACEVRGFRRPAGGHSGWSAAVRPSGWPSRPDSASVRARRVRCRDQRRSQGGVSSGDFAARVPSEAGRMRGGGWQPKLLRSNVRRSVD